MESLSSLSSYAFSGPDFDLKLNCSDWSLKFKLGNLVTYLVVQAKTISFILSLSESD